MNRSRLAPGLGSVVGLAAVLLLGAGTLPAAGSPIYTRINIPPRTTVYVQFQGSEMRLATSVLGLKDAEPVSATRAGATFAVFPEVTLPLTADELPRGWSKVRAAIYLYAVQTGLRSETRIWHVSAAVGPVLTCPERSRRSGVEGPSLSDTGGALWTYWFPVSAPTAAEPRSAPAWQIPNPTALRLTVMTHKARGRVGVVVRLTAGTAEVYDVQKNGKSVEVQVMVRDADGNGIASERGPLRKFGSQRDGRPRYFASVVMNGRYTCQVTLDTGPTGSLKAATVVHVP